MKINCQIVGDNYLVNQSQKKRKREKSEDTASKIDEGYSIRSSLIEWFKQTGTNKHTKLVFKTIN